MYTLSSPTVLATDAAAHTAAVPVLRALSAAFRVSQDGAYALAQAWHDRDETATDVGWTLVALLDMNSPVFSETLRSTGSALQAGTPADADALATGRFGTSSQVAALVASEASVWPDAAIAPIPGAGKVPASAAVVAASVAAHWASPGLLPDQVAAMRAPFEQAEASADLYEHGKFPYGPRTAEVLGLIELIKAGQVDAAKLSEVTWPAGVWSRAMHEAAWACLREGRLRAQMRAVIDVTLEFSLAHPELRPFQVRSCMPALHAMTVQRLVGDAMDEKSLGELALAEFSL
ncbi:hypothetical protein [Kineosporia babensis]|uniref:Uncharacterized protein n=1 Tax=Kineosporia babensis TaxID=499548 RepID=A0A9X1NLP7_9ACTN|nr:hypothetical protein [Kineosporia babensis]MCD5316094.1 hypothetical protein [Kineosporia babensis]